MLHSVGAAVVTAAIVGGWFGVDGNGKLKTEERSVPAFTGIEVQGGTKAEVRMGKERKVTLTTDENLLPYLKTEVRDGVLVVRSTEHINPKRDVRLVVVTPELNHLGASGGVELDAEVAASDSFSVEGSGGADLRIRGVDTKKLNTELSGGVDARLEGRADEARYELSGGVNLDCTRLEAKVAKLDASGGVKARLAVSERIEGDASGGVTVKVKGRPAMHVDTSGAASVRSE